MKRLLVALDSSARAHAVLSAAAHLAEATNAKLVLYRAVNIPPELPKELLNATDRSLEEILLRNAEGDLERLAKSVPAARIEKLTATYDIPWNGICRAARESEADMIVIGSHGFGGLDRILGTTAAKVVNHSDRSVLVVRTPIE